jgi:hypothetical protein
MNLEKKYLTIIITFFVVSVIVIGGFALWQYFTSFHKVTFNVKPANMSVDIYRIRTEIAESHEGTKIGSVKNGQELSLQEGKYFAVPQDKKYNESDIDFAVVDSDITVDIHPSFNPGYLDSLLKKELPVINQTILAKYPKITRGGFTLNPGKLYRDGTWYGTTIKQPGAAPDQNGDIYRVVLHKENGIWKFSTIPQIVLTAPENPSVPEDVLSDLNGQINP